MSVTVSKVAPGSIAEEIGIRAGDRIVHINGAPVRDSLDFLRADGGCELDIVWESLQKGRLACGIEKDEEEPLGITLEADRVRLCANRCAFCFVDQMAPGMRPTLYVKDDDWRTSFLHGSYVTLTNLTDAEISRILRERVSPLYVSVHAADPAVRAQLLGVPSVRASLDVLQKLAGGGIQMHAQAVLCPGVNDGDVLRETIEALYALHPQMLSLSVVPVGLTRFRRALPEVRPVSRQTADDVLKIVHTAQRRFLRRSGTRFVFAADELYLRARRALPPPDAYEGFSQLENGVGLVADFLAGAERALAAARPGRNWRYRVGSITGTSFFPVLRSFCRRLKARTGVPWEVRAVENRVFGRSVTVAGLLTGADAVNALRKVSWDAAFLPEIMFRDTGYVTLDGMTLAEIEEESGVRCGVARSSPAAFTTQLMQAAGGIR